MASFLTIDLAAGKSTVPNVRPAPLLVSECPHLGQMFRKALLENPQFQYDVELEGFPIVRVEWQPLCQTAGAVIVPSFVPARSPQPDAIALLLNGLESPEEMAAIRQRFPLSAEIWEDIGREPRRPLLANVYLCCGRMREPATVTILATFANAYFSTFGTGE